MGRASTATRERKTLRQIKLEQLVTSLDNIKAMLNDEMSDVIVNRNYTTRPSPLSEAEMIASLYFPELKPAMNKLMEQVINARSWIANNGDEIYKLSAGPARNTRITEIMREWYVPLRELLMIIEDLKILASQQRKVIVGPA